MSVRPVATALGRSQAQLRRVVSAGEALGLPPLHLLHAGPPLRDARQPPAVLRSAAVMTALHEGWAADADAAEALIAAGAIRWMPAQPRGCVVPLACVVSRGTPLFEVDAPDGGARMHAPVSAVRGPDTRMGHRDPALLGRLADRDRRIAPALQSALRDHGPVDLLALAAIGLANGDDLHSRTAAANAAWVAQWRGQHVDAAVLADLEATPLFFLTPWMAACASMLRSAEADSAGRPATLQNLVTRAGGNGETFGIALAGAPDRWLTAEADAPHGTRLPAAADALISGAIGDSAVIDLFGCGGLALAGAAEPLAAFAGHLPADHATLAARLGVDTHAVLARPVGVDAQRVGAERAAPLIALAMLCADGRGGFAGRGVYRPPLALFDTAR